MFGKIPSAPQFGSSPNIHQSSPNFHQSFCSLSGHPIDDIHFRKIFTEWEESIITPLYKSKGVALERGNYQGLKLLDQVMKVLQRVVENFLWQVHIHDMQFGFMPGCSTTDVIFIVRQLQEKFYAVNKTLYMVFVDLEKAFDQVPRRVICWALRKLGVYEWLVRLIQSIIKTPEAECVLVETLTKSSVWNWAFT